MILSNRLRRPAMLQVSADSNRVCGLRDEEDSQRLQFRRFLTHSDRVGAFIGELERRPAAKRAQFEWVFEALWCDPRRKGAARRHTPRSLELDIPDTILLREGKFSRWLFTSRRTGCVMKRQDQRLAFTDIGEALLKLARDDPANRARYVATVRTIGKPPDNAAAAALGVGGGGGGGTASGGGCSGGGGGDDDDEHHVSKESLKTYHTTLLDEGEFVPWMETGGPSATPPTGSGGLWQGVVAVQAFVVPRLFGAPGDGATLHNGIFESVLRRDRRGEWKHEVQRRSDARVGGAKELRSGWRAATVLAVTPAAAAAEAAAAEVAAVEAAAEAGGAGGSIRTPFAAAAGGPTYTVRFANGTTAAGVGARHVQAVLTEGQREANALAHEMLEGVEAEGLPSPSSAAPPPPQQKQKQMPGRAPPLLFADAAAEAAAVAEAEASAVACNAEIVSLATGLRAAPMANTPVAEDWHEPRGEKKAGGFADREGVGAEGGEEQAGEGAQGGEEEGQEAPATAAAEQEEPEEDNEAAAAAAASSSVIQVGEPVRVWRPQPRVSPRDRLLGPSAHTRVVSGATRQRLGELTRRLAARLEAHHGCTLVHVKAEFVLTRAERVAAGAAGERELRLGTAAGSRQLDPRFDRFVMTHASEVVTLEQLAEAEARARERERAAAALRRDAKARALAASPRRRGMRCAPPSFDAQGTGEGGEREGATEGAVESGGGGVAKLSRGDAAAPPALPRHARDLPRTLPGDDNSDAGGSECGASSESGASVAETTASGSGTRTRLRRGGNGPGGCPGLFCTWGLTAEQVQVQEQQRGAAAVAALLRGRQERQRQRAAEEAAAALGGLWRPKKGRRGGRGQRPGSAPPGGGLRRGLHRAPEAPSADLPVQVAARSLLLARVERGLLGQSGHFERLSRPMKGGWHRWQTARDAVFEKHEGVLGSSGSGGSGSVARAAGSPRAAGFGSPGPSPGRPGRPASRSPGRPASPTAGSRAATPSADAAAAAAAEEAHAVAQAAAAAANAVGQGQAACAVAGEERRVVAEPFDSEWVGDSVRQWMGVVAELARPRGMGDVVLEAMAQTRQSTAMRGSTQRSPHEAEQDGEEEEQSQQQQQQRSPEQMARRASTVWQQHGRQHAATASASASAGAAAAPSDSIFDRLSDPSGFTGSLRVRHEEALHCELKAPVHIASSATAPLADPSLYVRTLRKVNGGDFYRGVPVCLRCASMYGRLDRARRRMLQGERWASTTHPDGVTHAFDTRPAPPRPRVFRAASTAAAAATSASSVLDPPPVDGARPHTARSTFSPTKATAPSFSLSKDERKASRLAELTRLRRRQSYVAAAPARARRRESVYALTGEVCPAEGHERTLKSAAVPVHHKNRKQAKQAKAKAKLLSDSMPAALSQSSHVSLKRFRRGSHLEGVGRLTMSMR